MPSPRSLRALAAALTFTALAGTAMLTGPAAVAAPGTTDVRDASCTTGDTRALCAAPETLLDVRIGDVHPTQPSLGYDEVYYKLGRYSPALSKDAINKELGDWCEANGQEDVATAQPGATVLDPSTFTCTIPTGSETPASIAAMKTVVIGPGGTLYLTDGHHTLTSFDEASGPDVHVRLRVTGNLSGMGTDAFWQTMRDNRWVWLRDVDGNAITPAQLPENVGLEAFQDDRARSIMYFARDIGYSADGAVPFQEFYWGSWLRKQAPTIDLAGWDQDDWDASLALVKQITEAQVALPQDRVVDEESGYTARDLSTFTAWNDGAKPTKGEWAKLSKPYADAKPGKLAYMTAYRATLPAPTAPAAPAAPMLTAEGSTLTVAWTAPSAGRSRITGYTVTLSDGTTTTVDAPATTATFADVAPGTYTASVVATNAVGSSPASAASTPVTIAEATDPSDPTNPGPTDPTDPQPGDPTSPAPTTPAGPGADEPGATDAGATGPDGTGTDGTTTGSLAFTGSDGIGAAALAALATIALGTGAVVLRRRRTTR